jgi:UDP-N-acetyl-D-mannosaminuronic acid dehydrogenase
MKNDLDWDVCVVGLGYVGLTLATAFAAAGLRVAGIERNQATIDIVNSGASPFHEFGLTEAISAVVADHRLTAFQAETKIVAPAYVITVGTPVRNGNVYLEDLKAAVESVARVMPEGALTALRSTVRVGTTRDIAAPILRKSGKPFALAMTPERTIEGKALAELSSLPQIVGGVDDASFDAASKLFSKLGIDVVKVANAETAELSKLASNTFRDLNFAFANELAYFADESGVDVYEVVHACNFGYDRMSLAKPGPVAGPCLEKDAYILADSAAQLGISVPLSMQGRKTNELVVPHVLKLISSQGSSPQSASIVGIAFKGQPETSDVRGSLAINFANGLKESLSLETVSGWDPVVSETDARTMGVVPVDLEQALNSDVIVIQTNHRFFKSDEFANLVKASLKKGSLVVDLWNQLPEDLQSQPGMVTLGRSSSTKGYVK